MAECNVFRCSHERRIFRRELQKWSKEILYILGLERLAEELMGAWKWKILVQPFTDLESNNPVDWYPEEMCYFCCAKKQPPYDPASGIIPSIESYSPLQIDTDEPSTASDQLKSSSFVSCTALSPWGMSTLPSSVANSSLIGDQPLDLSIGTQHVLGEVTCSLNETLHSDHINNSTTKNTCLKSVLKVPQIPLKHGLRKRVDANSKRSYTEEELQAALRDIQSGKLGTRRAAVIYGIPRSTLRNKVYKLANESKSRAHCRINQSTGTLAKKEDNKYFQFSSEIDIPAYNSVNQHNISSASESLRQLLKDTICQKVHCTSKNSEKSKSTFPIADIHSMTELQMLENLECSQSLDPVLSHVFSDIQNLALVKSKENFHCSNSSFNALQEDMKLPLLPDLIRRLAEERIELEKDIHKGDIEQDESVDMSSTCTQSNVILKVPSFKPAKSSSTNPDLENPSLPALLSSSPPPQMSSHSFSGNKGIAVSLKELIARSINQKVSCHLKEEQSLEYPFSSSNVEIQPNSFPWVNENVHKDEKESCLNNTNNSSNSSDSIKSEKRTRPKRGRYRNYDRDNLARAVRAVQKGEMSVHRAGTFYGVPHSTLEYKVKERHLLRPKKKDIFNNSLLNDANESMSAPKKNQTFSVENNVSLKNLKNNLNSFEASSDNELSHRPVVDSYPSPLSIWQSLPFLSLDFAQLGGSNNFFASQMMRKLQENARIHEETQTKQRKEDFGVLETLIKSTLEKSVASDNKSCTILSSDSATTLSDSKVAENEDK